MLSIDDFIAAMMRQPTVYFEPEEEGGTVLRYDLPRKNEFISISSRGVHYIADHLPSGWAQVIVHDSFHARIPRLIAVSEQAALAGVAPIGCGSAGV